MTTQSAGPIGYRTDAEIRSQPNLWRSAIAVAGEVLGLPVPGERVLLLGCGTSYYVGQAYAALREQAGQGVTDALIASEVPDSYRPYDLVLAISRSGRSSELLDAVRAFRGQQPDVPVTALLGEQGTPLADLVDTVVDLSFADEQSLVQTRFPTTQLILLRTALAGHTDGPDQLGRRAIEALPAQAEAALAGPIPEPQARQLVVLGHGWGTAIAEEAALKVREAAAQWAEAYAVGEYRHGPIATCGPGTIVWGLDPLPTDIAEAVRGLGGQVVDGGGEPLVELVRLHRFALALATARGRDADRPGSLNRSVVLPEAGVTEEPDADG